MTPDSSSNEEIRRFEEQYERQPDSLVFARLADAYRKAGEPKRALSVLEDGLLRHPDYPSGHIVHARTLRDLGRLDETLESFRRVLELDASNLVAIRELASLAEERGDVDEARHWYERLVQIEPSNVEYQEKASQLAANAEPESSAASDAGIQLNDGSPWSEWWDDSAVTMEPGAAESGPEALEEAAGALEQEDDPAVPQGGPIELVIPAPAGEEHADGDPPAEPGPADEAVEAILNGDVPHTVKAEDTWWYEEAADSAEPEPQPSRDADLLTRTMADLYAEQGLHAEAEAIYRELLAASPDDPDLLERLEAVRLTAGERQAQPLPPEPEPQQEPGSEPRGTDDRADVRPVGPPAGVPVAEELRQLLRHGERRARDLPDPEEVAPDPEEAVPVDDARPSERAAPGGGAEEAGPESVRAEEPEPSMGEFAREWLRGLEGRG